MYTQNVKTELLAKLLEERLSSLPHPGPASGRFAKGRLQA